MILVRTANQISASL